MFQAQLIGVFASSMQIGPYKETICHSGFSPSLVFFSKTIHSIHCELVIVNLLQVFLHYLLKVQVGIRFQDEAIKTRRYSTC